MKLLFYGICVYLALFKSIYSHAQFAPAVGVSGTTAMHKDSSAFIDWAEKCHIVRGLQDISNESLGLADVGDSTMALGKAGSNGVVSLGDGGIAILQFNSPIIDANGYDFAVFENSFDGQFLELAFVEVSSDGINYFRFPATSNTDTTTQTNGFGYTNPTQINNLAGKYKALYGTPFDLSDIIDNPLLNKQAITHIKLIDVVGSISPQYCTRDKDGKKINDPWPTGFGSSGFDLDAVGVIHNQAFVGTHEQTKQLAHVFPNPASNVLHINCANNQTYSVSIQSLLGENVLSIPHQQFYSLIDISLLPKGVYIISISNNEQTQSIKLIKE